ncbi:MAG: 4-hydroxybenzoate octaprenyltransferase, partial [Acinetobacter sp.]
EYDLKIGVKSTAILFGKYDIEIISILQALSVVLIATAFYLENILIPFGLAALLLVCADFIYQWTKTNDRDPQRCFWAFRHNRWVGLIIFIGIFASFI